jgi:hypothetical protein
MPRKGREELAISPEQLTHIIAESKARSASKKERLVWAHRVREISIRAFNRSRKWLMDPRAKRPG